MKLFKNLRLFRSFKKILNQNRVLLEGDYKIRIDKAFRMYTVLNVPEELFGEPYNIRTGDIDTISQTYLRDYIRKLSEFLNSKGLSELYDFYEPVKRVEKYSYLIVLGFKPFNSLKYNNILYFRIIPIISLLLLIGLMVLIF
jgi:hypothetical protein